MHRPPVENNDISVFSHAAFVILLDWLRPLSVDSVVAGKLYQSSPKTPPYSFFLRCPIRGGPLVVLKFLFRICGYFPICVLFEVLVSSGS